MPSAVDQRAFRDVMGCFATGVTVLTTVSDGVARGMTANAVVSVSLSPPLVLACIDQRSESHMHFAGTRMFGVNILAEDQRELSDAFARKGDKHISAGTFKPSPLGAPVLDGAIAWAECTVVERLERGDHTLLLGEVTHLGLAMPTASPLLFFAGRYRAINSDA